MATQGFSESGFCCCEPRSCRGWSALMLFAAASWLRSGFKQQLLELCSEVNAIDSETTLEEMGFQDLRFEPSTHPLQPDSSAAVLGEQVGLLVAPIKAKDRALAKIENDYQVDFKAGKKQEMPLARYLCDFLRATIFASDPFVLAVAFHKLKEHPEVVRVKNKFRDEKTPETRTNILVNLWIRHGDEEQIGEVQFLLQDYLTAKSLQHLYYDVVRAERPAEPWDKPIFR
mmetsp:Transcript_34888/g.64989  ORF Transcript_34888/g.64989 Transcript_34888/m.64989 type:complete len:229 (+) Transcript_34888:127-813(+)